MDEVGHLAVAEALGDLLQANRAGGQQLFGEGLAHLVEQQAVAAALVVQAATQGTHGEVQFHGQGLHVRQVAGRPQQAVADASGETAAHLAAGEQGAALLLAGARHLWIGAGQREVEEAPFEDHPVVRLAERRAQAQLAHVGRGIGGRWAAEAGAEDRQALPGEVALDAQHATGVAFEEENPQVLGNAGVVEHQVRFVVVYLQADAMEGEGQVEVAQAQLRGAEEGRAAEQGEAPDAVGVEVIAQACRQARCAGVAQVPDQVAHYAQFLGRVDFPGGIAEQADIQAATCQALLQAEAAVDAELDQQVRADGAAAGRPGRSGHGGVRG